MDIVDAQYHFGPGRIDETLAAMDALGIAAVLIDEYWSGYEPPGSPSVVLGAGVRRNLQPTSQLASILYPERFSYLVRLDREDPEVTSLIRLARDAPGARAVRITPGTSRREAAEFARGGYDAICAAACDAGLPLFMFVPGQPRDVVAVAQKFPALKLVVDHCGLLANSMRHFSGVEGPPVTFSQQLVNFEAVLALAEFPNVALKWGHAPGMFEVPGYPGMGLWPILRRTIDRFGPERVMWASDASVNTTGESWAELLFSVIGNISLTAQERALVLGGAARAWLNWPAAAAQKIG